MHVAQSSFDAAAEHAAAVDAQVCRAGHAPRGAGRSVILGLRVCRRQAMDGLVFDDAMLEEREEEINGLASTVQVCRV